MIMSVSLKISKALILNGVEGEASLVMVQN